MGQGDRHAFFCREHSIFFDVFEDEQPRILFRQVLDELVHDEVLIDTAYEGPTFAKLLKIIAPVEDGIAVEDIEDLPVSYQSLRFANVTLYVTTQVSWTAGQLTPTLKVDAIFQGGISKTGRYRGEFLPEAA